MSDEVKLNIWPTPVNPIVDNAADVTYIFVVYDAGHNEVDFEGYTAKMQLRPYVKAKRVYDEMTTEDGRIKIDGGRITLWFPAHITVDYKFDHAVYDLVVTSPAGTKYRVAEGEVSFRGAVTR